MVLGVPILKHFRVYVTLFLHQDVSCNQIAHLPMQIGDLKSLKSLNMRRNLLVELPIGE